MTNIPTVTPEDSSGVRRMIINYYKRKSGGYLPGIMKVVLEDLHLGMPSYYMYNHFHLRDNSPLTRLQREMIATVVNGKIGGMP